MRWNYKTVACQPYESAAYSPGLVSLMVRLLFLSLLGIQGALALSTSAQESRKHSSAKAYVNPNLGGGAMVDISSSGIKEPLNVSISPRLFSRPAALTTDSFTLRFFWGNRLLYLV